MDQFELFDDCMGFGYPSCMDQIRLTVPQLSVAEALPSLVQVLKIGVDDKNPQVSTNPHSTPTSTLRLLHRHIWGSQCPLGFIVVVAKLLVPWWWVMWCRCLPVPCCYWMPPSRHVRPPVSDDHRYIGHAETVIDGAD